MTKEEAELGAAALRDALTGPTGPLPFERVLAREEHRAFIAALRAAQAPWPSIVSLLIRAGVTGPGGHPLTADGLRASYSRVTNAVKSPATAMLMKASPVAEAATFQTGAAPPSLQSTLAATHSDPTAPERPAPMTERGPDLAAFRRQIEQTKQSRRADLQW